MDTPALRLLSLVSLLAAGSCGGEAVVDGADNSTSPSLPWSVSADGWRTDAVWYDGQAERATYDAVRVIYGVERSYTAIAYTNKQLMDPTTTTKASGTDSGGVEVFKHHWSERAPTERYDYDFSTCTFTRTDDLAPFKLTAATQEDCGASFKQIWRTDENDGELAWIESIYFPDAGFAEGTLADTGGLHFADALPLVLRDYPFDAPPELTTLNLIASQKSTRHRSFAPETHMVTYVGRESLDLPLGSVDSHHLHVGAIDSNAWWELWFAAEGGEPWLHVLVRSQDHEGTNYELASLERTAYWER